MTGTAAGVPPHPGRIALLVLLLAVLAGGLTACDPCFGTLDCRVEPRIVAEGQLVVLMTGTPAEGVLVEFVQTGAVDGVPDTLVATTDSEGRFRFEHPAPGREPIHGKLVFHPPAPIAKYAYSVEGVTIVPTDIRGDKRFLGTWGVGPIRVDPRIYHVGELFDRATGGAPPAGTKVEFRQTGGVELTRSSVTVTPDATGRFLLNVRAKEEGAVEGFLVVRPPAPFDPDTVRGLRLETTVARDSVAFLGRWGVGPRLVYVAELFDRATGGPAAGIEVVFRRTGGIRVEPDTFTVRTNERGAFVLELSPADEGELIGELEIRPPAPYRQEVVPVRLTTTHKDGEVRFLGRWGVGFNLAYVGEIVRREDYGAMPGVEVEFRRTGGIRVEPDTLTVKTDENGRFLLAPRPLEEGEVLGQLIIRPPAPFAELRVPEVRLSTSVQDGEVRFLGVWAIERP